MGLTVRRSESRSQAPERKKLVKFFASAAAVCARTTKSKASKELSRLGRAPPRPAVPVELWEDQHEKRIAGQMLPRLSMSWTDMSVSSMALAATWRESGTG